MAKKKADEKLDLALEEGKGSKKKLIILILAGVLLLGGGGAGVAWFLAGDDGQEQAEAEDPGVQPAADTKAPALYQALDPVFVVNLPGGGRLKMLQIGVEVMARDPLLIDFIKANDPMIRNSLLNLFSAQDGKQLKSREGKEKLQADVLTSINELIAGQGGPGSVEAVYFTSFVMQ